MKDKTNSKPTLEIHLDKDGDLVFTGLKKKRFTHYGFGTFLENVEPGEVSITKDALSILLKQPYRSGLQGAEFWPDNRLAWGDPGLKIAMSPKQVSVHDRAEKWIKKFTVEEKG